DDGRGRRIASGNARDVEGAVPSASMRRRFAGGVGFLGRAGRDIRVSSKGACDRCAASGAPVRRGAPSPRALQSSGRAADAPFRGSRSGRLGGTARNGPGIVQSARSAGGEGGVRGAARAREGTGRYTVSAALGGGRRSLRHQPYAAFTSRNTANA